MYLRAFFVNQGRIEFEGTYENFSKNKEFLKHLPHTDESEKLLTDGKDIVKLSRQVSISSTKFDDKEKKQPEVTEEFLAKGRVETSMYFKYLKMGTAYFAFFILILSFLVTQIFVSGFDYWLAFW